MGILKFPLFLFLIFPIVHSLNVCSSSFCGNIQIKYPFKLQGQETGNNCTYINLTCSNQGIPILNLPFSGDFYVNDIDYYDNIITLHDPSDCLPGRLLNNSINLTSSPFSANYYENYTFYTCPANSDPVGYYAVAITCLSNSTNATVASQEPSDEFEYFGCEIIGSSLLPVMFQGQFEDQGINGDLSLHWDVSDCKYCDPQPLPQEKGKSGLIKFLNSPFLIPSFFLLVSLLLSCCALLIKITIRRNEVNASADPNSATAAALSQSTIPNILPRQSGQAITGLDDSRIRSYTELVVVGENQSIAGQGNSSCAICLAAYNPKEEVRSIAKCGHFFHNDCIVMWLKRNSTCPVCRSLLSDVKM
ncbi:unnamed protein product [Fraxinus pennsylvanica]|uniref:RING-type E3 ubiquitin transferase n=1 Tax=Fraxinus pennsylvanica TaxID=56036 RepID=A0AAD1ZKE1_9LAMI|nr:unnamed protein product [Fraxinus pennsylvanica]